MGILLAILSVTLVWISSPFLLIYSFVRLKWFSEVNNHYFVVAVSIDQLGNVVGAPLFNDIMITREGYKYGLEDETISSVLGRNYKTNTLRFTGKVLRWTLDHIEENHCIKSIGK